MRRLADLCFPLLLACVASVLFACGGGGGSGSGGGGGTGDVQIAQSFDGTWVVTVTDQTSDCPNAVLGIPRVFEIQITSTSGSSSVTILETGQPVSEVFNGVVEQGQLKAVDIDGDDRTELRVTLTGGNGSFVGDGTTVTQLPIQRTTCVTAFTISAAKLQNCTRVSGSWRFELSGGLAVNSLPNPIGQVDCLLVFDQDDVFLTGAIDGGGLWSGEGRVNRTVPGGGQQFDFSGRFTGDPANAFMGQWTDSSGMSGNLVGVIN